MIDHSKDPVDESLAFGVGLECALIFTEQKDGSSVALPEEVLADVLARFVFELNAIDVLRYLEVGRGKFDFHKVSPRDWTAA